jgi:hypothetical protein
MNYVEVIFLLNGFFDSRKALPYPTKEEAEAVYIATVKKFREEKRNALVCLRGGGNCLLKSEMIK